MAGSRTGRATAGVSASFAATFPRAAAAAAAAGRVQPGAKPPAFKQPTNSAFEGARAGRRLGHWTPGQVTTRREALDHAALRARAYDLARNNPLAVGMVERMCSEMLGTGIAARVAGVPSDKPMVKAINELWDAWCADCLVGTRMDIHGWLEQQVSDWLVGGEAFTVLRALPTASGVPLRLAGLGPERLAGEYDFAAMKKPLGAHVEAGVQTDADGMITHYWLYQNAQDASAWDLNAKLHPVAVPASRVTHLLSPKRSGQMRGATRFAATMVRLHGLDALQDGVLERQKLQNLIAAFVLRKPAHDDGGTDALGRPIADGVSGGGEGAAAAQERQLPGLEPGIMAEVEGDDIKFSDPRDAGANYADFCTQQVMDICTAFGVPYQIVTWDFSKANDREMRVALNAFRRALRGMIFKNLVPMVLEPVRQAFFDAAILSGALPPAAAKYRKTEWVPTRWEYINPLQDARAVVELIDAGLESRSGHISAGESTPQEVDRLRAEDAAREAQLGLAASGASPASAGAEG